MLEPIVIIGAPRSGTNILRDMLVKLPGIDTWPCDEINYIWRHGNVRYPSDEFSAEMADDRTCRYIRSQFKGFVGKSGLDAVVEKTCANSLRVGFVDKVLPEAKYIFIVRDGMDVVGSALIRWQASFDLNYVLSKARYVPLSDIPYYGSRYLANHLYRLFSREKRLAYWGPTLNNMNELLARHSLIEVCALQWRACVENAERDFAEMLEHRIHRVGYEQFVDDPAREFARLGDFLGREIPGGVSQQLRDGVRSDSVGKGRSALGEKAMESLRPLLNDTLVKYGYV